MLWCRFYLNIKKVNEDYRPVIWPIKYPYWCSGESFTDFIIVAYVDSLDELYKQWPEAHDIDSEEVKKIEFSSRFPKPDWYTDEYIKEYDPSKVKVYWTEEKKEKKSKQERFIEKFGHWWYLRELDFFPEACENHLDQFKMSGKWLELADNKKWLMFNNIEKACSVAYAIRKSLGMEDYDFSSIIEYYKEIIKDGR